MGEEPLPYDPPDLDSDGMMRAPVFNVAGSSPHGDEDPHPTGVMQEGWLLMWQQWIRKAKLYRQAQMKQARRAE